MREMGTDKLRSPGWMKILLALSFAINLAVVGLVAGALLRPDGAGHRFSRGPGLGAFGTPYMHALSKQERRAVFAAMRDASKEDLPNRRMRREMFQEVLTGLRATPFDVAALEAAVARQASVSVSVQQRVQQAWLELVAGMDDAERARYADAVEEALKRGHKRR